MERATLSPSSRTRRRTLRSWMASPSRAAGTPKRAPAPTTRRSAAQASSVPAPSAGPSTAAITGWGSSGSPSSSALSATRNSSEWTPWRSAPAQNARPAPVMTTTRAPSPATPCTASWRSRQCSVSRALRRSDRSMVTSATRSCRSVRITSPPRAQRGSGTGSAGACWSPHPRARARRRRRWRARRRRRGSTPPRPRVPR